MKLLEDYSYEGGSRLAPPPAARAPVAVERQLSCSEWPGNHALLDQATKYEPTTAGVASVDAERQRLKAGLEVDGSTEPWWAPKNPAFDSRPRRSLQTGYRRRS